MPCRILLVRHAQSAPDRSVPEPQWPLSSAGHAQATELCGELCCDNIARLVASPFDRAIATLQPLADKLGLPIDVDDALRERQLAAGLIDNWLDELERSWADFDRTLPGGESARACQARVADAMTRIASAAPGTTIAVCSHGNAIALFLNSIDPTFGFGDWREMRNPHVFRLTYDDGTWAIADR
mmetsp:Transcript_18659/g.57381  ORF Transcript_18659/g.57381 Transcript_18659/m.57381 type:complete len:184 (+) Transcript_18659:46-597(+)